METRRHFGGSISYWALVVLLVVILTGFAFWSGRASAGSQPQPTIATGVDRQSTVVALNADQAFGLSGYGVYKAYRLTDQGHTCYLVVSLFDHASSIDCPK